MSDEPIKLAEGMTSARVGAKVLGHLCEHEGCLMHAGFGFARLRQDPHWFCFEHRDDGERYL
ncbi:hypothetical protein EN784_01720 [bacterium M00.F.Ca.ET.141.01.1.1]|nr:hypothetical protein EN784_01720 [bacterium M00.F.Ca.ET.141.01.1.1]